MFQKKKTPTIKFSKEKKNLHLRISPLTFLHDCVFLFFLFFFLFLVFLLLSLSLLFFPFLLFLFLLFSCIVFFFFFFFFSSFTYFCFFLIIINQTCSRYSKTVIYVTSSIIDLMLQALAEFIKQNNLYVGLNRLWPTFASFLTRPHFKQISYTISIKMKYK